MFNKKKCSYLETKDEEIIVSSKRQYHYNVPLKTEYNPLTHLFKGRSSYCS